MSIKNCYDPFGDRTVDLQACGAVPKPTAPPLAPKFSLANDIKVVFLGLFVDYQSAVTLSKQTTLRLFFSEFEFKPNKQDLPSGRRLALL
jgi:hypothetical protein